MPSKIKKLAAFAVAHLPGNALRCAVYRMLFGYTIGPGSHIGWGVVLCVEAFDCGPGTTIRRFTRFVGPIHVRLGAKTFVGRRNRFECGDGAATSKVAHMGYTRTLVTGEDSLINEDHLFDVLGTISIGAGTWVAGFGSQFLTHGAGTMDRDIRIGDRCFVGSAARFAPGSGVGDEVIVAMGSVVAKRIAADRAVVGGVPAKVLKARDAADDYVFQKVWT